MKIVDKVLHFLVPRSSNNHKSQAVHTSTISFYISLLLVFQIGLTLMTRFYPSVLGYATNINIGDLLSDTNAERTSHGAGTVGLNDQLSDAARRKAADMFANQYWAHISPSGKDPWSFMVAAGYNFVFAGENLARDFADSKSVVDAWMNSPSHRENLLNPRYKDIGFAVLDGKYGDKETTLVVQMFGTPASAAPTVEAPQTTTTPTPTPPVPTSTVTEPIPATPSTTIPTPPPPSNGPGTILNIQSSNPSQPKIDILQVTRVVSMGLIGFLVLIFITDGIIAYRQKAVRISGHNFAHMVFLLAVLVAINLIGRSGLTI